MIVKQFSGHSGCKIFLHKQQNIYFVRKISSSLQYNSRLMRQCLKQKHFNSLYLKAPKIYNYGYSDEGLFFFDMEYIQGVSLATALKKITLNEIERLINLLFNLISIYDCKFSQNTLNIFKSKINELDNKIINKDTCVKNAFTLLNNYNFGFIPKSYCCGDLTLENILLTPSKDLYVIDFLDSFYNSWMIDISKLLQDLELGWSYRFETVDFNLNLRLNTAKNILLSKIDMYHNGKKIIEGIYMLLLLNTLRIVPYIEDNTTKIFVKDSLDKILNILSEIRKN